MPLSRGSPTADEDVESSTGLAAEHEVDLVVARNDERVAAIEVKLSRNRRQ